MEKDNHSKSNKIIIEIIEIKVDPIVEKEKERFKIIHERLRFINNKLINKLPAKMLIERRLVIVMELNI